MQKVVVLLANGGQDCVSPDIECVKKTESYLSNNRVQSFCTIHWGKSEYSSLHVFFVSCCE